MAQETDTVTVPPPQSPPPPYTTPGTNQPQKNDSESSLPGYVSPPPGYSSVLLADRAREIRFETPLTGYKQTAYLPTTEDYLASQIISVTRPPDYMTLSLISCCFCWPLSVCAIIAANNSRISADCLDFERAKRDGQIAKNIAMASIFVGSTIIATSIAIRLIFS